MDRLLAARRFSCSGQSVTQIKKEWSFRVARVRLWKKRKRSAIYMNLPHGVCASFIFFSFIIFLLVTWNLSTRWKKFAYWPRHSFLIHVYDKWKKTHKKPLSYYKIFFIFPIKKKLESEKKQILLQLNPQTIQFIQPKNLPLLKETRHRKSHKKNNGEKNPWLYFIKSLKKINKWIKKNLKSDKTLHNPTRTEATTCKKKTESTTKQSHIRTHKKKQFSSIKQNLFNT